MRRIALLTVALATTAVAQDRPPRLLRVAPLPRPASETREAIEVRVVVDAQGHATLEACDAPPSLCASAEIAIANGQFGPASRDGAPIAARVTVRLVLADAEPAAQSTAGPSTAGPSTAGATPLPERRLLEAPPPEELGVTALVATAEEGARRIALD
ncbi:MAG: hypothetical protein IT378_07500, partial [Sandaracinaceae bacterium]|nr:hypothetical protein [Sandaracinaceae bacterium]